MKKNIGFDHLIGETNSQLGEKDLKIYQSIIKAHSDGQSIENKRLIKHIGLRLEMEDYIDSNYSEIITAGFFLERLLKIYDVRKSQFAAFIGVGKTNFYALLKGRRKLNNSIATKVGKTFNIDPELWMFVEAKNEIKQYRNKSHEENKKYNLTNLLNER